MCENFRKKSEVCYIIYIAVFAIDMHSALTQKAKLRAVLINLFYFIYCPFLNNNLQF